MNINDLNPWAIKVFLLLFVGAVVSAGEWLIYRYLLPRFKRRGSAWGVSFLLAFHNTCQCYVWFLVITFIISSFTSLFHTTFVTHVIVVRQMGSLLFLLWFALRFFRHAERELVNRSKIGVGRVSDPTNIQAIAQLLRMVVILFVALMALQTAGIKLSAVLTVGSVAMAVFGFAAKDMLSNFLGGFIIYWDRPFSVGDWIRSPDRNIEGTVEYIGWRVTRIFTPDKRPLYVPNSILTGIALENPSRMTHRQFKLTVGVRYSDAERVPAIVETIDAMLRNHPGLDPNERVSVSFYELSPSSLDILIYAFTREIRWSDFHPIRQDILLKLMAIVREQGAEWAFPTQTIEMPDGLLWKEYANQGTTGK